MTQYLLDADAIIEVLRGNSISADFIEGLYLAGETPCTCDVVVAEVLSGLHARHRAQGQAFLDSMLFLKTSPAAARQAGLWRYEFRSRGIQLTTTDCLIAAVALDQQATLITGNVRHFPMPDITILPLPRWQ
jgi:predicted nucleic acid-binding protein